jgi:hypothetical protein
MTTLCIISAMICVAGFAIGFGFVVPVNGIVGDSCDIVAIGSGMCFLGLLDGE